MADTPINFGATNDAVEQYKSDVNAGIVPDSEAQTFYNQNPSPLVMQQPQFMQPQVMSNGQPVPAMVPQMSQPIVVQQPQQQAPDASQYAKPMAVPVAQQRPADDPAKAAAPLLGTYDTQQKAQTAIARAAADKSTLDEMAQQDAAQKIAESEQKQQLLQKEYSDSFNSKMAGLDEMSKQLASPEFADAKVDQNRLFANMGTGQKILAGIAIALGGYGGALTGRGDNKAMDIINKAIDRDVETQKFNIQNQTQNLKNRMAAESTMLSTLRQKYGDDLQAESALRLLQLNKIEMQLKQYASRNESQAVQENAKFLNAQIEREKQTWVQQLKAQTALGSLSATSQLSPAQMAGLPKEVREQLQKQQETMPPSSSEWVGQAPNKEVLNKFIEKQNEIQPAVEGIQRILTMSKDLNRITDLEKKARIQTEMKALAGQLRVPFTGPGALTENEYERLMDTLGDQTSLTGIPSIQRAKLLQVSKKLDSDLDTIGKNSGFRRKSSTAIPTLRPYGK